MNIPKQIQAQVETRGGRCSSVAHPQRLRAKFERFELALDREL
jgi:hypothetical protein